MSASMRSLMLSSARPLSRVRLSSLIARLMRAMEKLVNFMAVGLVASTSATATVNQPPLARQIAPQHR